MTYKEALYKYADMISGKPYGWNSLVAPPPESNLRLQLFGMRANKSPLMRYTIKQLGSYKASLTTPYFQNTAGQQYQQLEQDPLGIKKAQEEAQ